jgi:uncharacterized protein (TIGR02996 family)
VSLTDLRAEELLAAVLADPDDVGARLVYADFLMERGDPRGELIQVQCKLAEAGARDAKLERREKRLLEKHGARWVSPFGLWFEKVAWRRGFVESVVVNARVLPAALRETLRHTPLRHATVTTLSPQTWRAMIDVPELAKLRSLDLSNARVFDEEVVAFAESPYVAGLRALVIADVPVGAGGAAALSRSSYLRELRALGLDGTAIGEEGAVTIARAPFALRRLTLRGDQVRAAGARAIAASERLAGLTLLDLRLNPIGDEGVLALARSSVLARLSDLRVDEKGLGDEARRALETRRSGTKGA